MYVHPKTRSVQFLMFFLKFSYIRKTLDTKKILRYTKDTRKLVTNQEWHYDAILHSIPEKFNLNIRIFEPSR